MGEASSVATKFFAAVEAEDESALRKLCSETFSATQNNGPTMDFNGLVAFSRSVKKAVPDFRYSNAVVSDTDSGFVEEHDIEGTLPDGSEFKMRLCVVAGVDNGQITSMREYVDSYAARPLIKALSNG